MSQSGFLKQLSRAVRSWWREQSGVLGVAGTIRLLAREVWEFLRDSTPERRRQRYGDMEYDWDHHVNTTAGTVGWRERLLGTFLSAYQPTEPDAFHEMMSALPIDFHEFTFVDLGSGKGRTLLMASEYPFRQIFGVEILPGLHEAAEASIRAYDSPTQKCPAIQSVCCDAREFTFPEEPLLVYLFNPLPEKALREVLTRLGTSLARSPRSLWIAYYNPLLETVLAAFPWLEKVIGRPNIAIYRAKDDAGNTLG